MNARNANPRKVVNLRLDVELYARLAAFAERTERSANGAAVLAIRTFLDAQDTNDKEIHLR